jgi:hypothetical protein
MPAIYSVKSRNGGTVELSYQEMLKEFKSGAITGSQLAKYAHGTDWVPVEDIISEHTAFTKKFLKVAGLIGAVFVAIMFGYLTFGDSFQPIGLVLFSALLIVVGCITYAIGKHVFLLGYFVFVGLLLMEGQAIQLRVLVLMATFYTFGGIIKNRLSARGKVQSATSPESKQKN